MRAEVTRVFLITAVHLNSLSEFPVTPYEFENLSNAQ